MQHPVTEHITIKNVLLLLLLLLVVLLLLVLLLLLDSLIDILSVATMSDVRM